MKNSLFLTVVLLLSSIISFGQLQIDKSIILNSATPSDARVTGIKQTSAAQDAVSAEVLQSGSLVYAVTGGVSTAYTLTLTPALGAYTGGMEITFRAHVANAAGPVTLNVNTLGAKTIKKSLNTDLAANDIQTGQLVTVAYDAVNNVFQLMSIPSGLKVALNTITSYTTAGSGGVNTYTKPSNLAFIVVELWGGGGGGGGSPASCGCGTNNGSPGGAGGQSLFPTVSPLVTVNGGAGGSGLNIAPSCGGFTPGGTQGGAGAAISTGGDVNSPGAAGGPGTNSSGCCMGTGGMGGGGAGGAAGVNGATGGNGGFASGGGGGATPVGNQAGAGGGGGGGYAMKKIAASALAASVSFTVGAGGTSGAGGGFSCGGGPSPTSGVAGGAGGPGRVVIYEYTYQ